MTASPNTAYTGVAYGADVPLEFSEIDPVQNKSVQAAVTTAGFSETAIRVLRDTVSSVTVNVDASGNPIGGTNYAVNDVVNIIGGGYSTQATAHVSSVDPTTGAITGLSVDNAGAGYTSVPSLVTVNSTTGNGAQLTANLTLSTGSPCSDGVAACYPPVVNYTPLYYLINGVAFNKTNATGSLFNASGIDSTTGLPITLGISGNVLVRLVNAGLRMHVPSIVGSTTGTNSPGMSLIAEDGNVFPDIARAAAASKPLNLRVQSEVFMAAGKTYDVMINATPACSPAPCSSPALPIFDRQLSLSGGSINRDSGMLAYISINGSSIPSGAGGIGVAVANADTYNAVACQSSGCNTLNVSDVSKGLIANDTNVFGVKVFTQPTSGALSLNSNGTFSYTPISNWAGPDTFVYIANGASACQTDLTTPGPCATVTLNKGDVGTAGGILMGNSAYTSSLATYLKIAPPGILLADKDTSGYPLKVALSTVSGVPSCISSNNQPPCVAVDENGGFVAVASAGTSLAFTYKAQNSQGTTSSNVGTVSVTFPASRGLAVTVLDGNDKKTTISDYRWIIEEDRTFYVDPKCTTNPPPAGCPGNGGGVVPNFGTNFHSSSMPVIAAGCTGPNSCEARQSLQGQPVVCDEGNGICRPDLSGNGQMPIGPGQVAVCSIATPDVKNCIDPNKRYYISVLPGDAADPFKAGYAGAPDCSADGVAAGSCGHGMGGAPISAGQLAVKIYTQPSPYPTAKLTVFVFEDDFPLNGEHDAGGGLDVLAPNEPGLGGFEVTIFDDAGGTGDATGQPTYDMFNMPLTNSLAGSIDPMTNLDACPISPTVTANVQTGDQSQKGIVGMILTCPTYESDGVTLSPFAGQAVVPNLYQGRYGDSGYA